MLLKKTGIIIIMLLSARAYSQQLVRATDVQLVSTSGTKIVVNGGITFKGTSNWKATADSVYIYKTTSASTEGWLDSTAAGVLDVTGTGNVFFRGGFLQSIYGKSRFYNLFIRNTVGDTLLSSTEVRNILNLDTGFVFTRSGYGNDSLLVSNPAIAAVVSTSSFTKSWVNGRLSRTGNVVGSPTPDPAVYYLFPVGKTDSLYAPIKFAKVNASTATWTAEYFDGLPFDYTNVFNPPIDHISRMEYWEINSNDQASTNDDARLSLSWRGHSKVSNTAAIRDSLLVVQYINQPSNVWNAPGSWATGNVVGPDSTTGYVTSNAATNNYSFDERRFTLGTFSKYNALPARLIYFTAIADGSKVRLNWEAANEQDTRTYEVERSLNAVNFYHLSAVSSLQQVQSAYVDYDPAPVTGWNYYRLKVIDKTGAYYYSPVRKVKFDKGLEEVKIFPNPVNDLLHIQLPSSYINSALLQVYGIDGRIVSSLKPQANMVLLNVQPLASGTYVIQIIKTNGDKETYRFVKQ